MNTAQARMPKGIPYIIGNELAERFSFYGMKGILTVFMTKYLIDSSGALDLMNDNQAKYWYHIFVMGTYFTPIFGALLADVLFGKYRTIIALSIVYCLGHLALALDETRMGLTIGLTLIAIGSGGIKPCVSAHVGDQFGEENKSLLDKIFGYFYMAINLGAAISTLLTPLLLKHYGPHVAFGVPGLLMLIATIVFWMGRKEFVAVKPVGLKQYLADLVSPEGKKAILNLVPIYLVLAVFWSLFDQTGSSWVLQADDMNRMVNLGFTKFELLPSQIQAINPILILTFVPLFMYVLYPFIGKFMELTAMKKITAGMLLSGLSFAICAYAESRIQAGFTPSILIQFAAYVILTAAEVMVSVTALEFAYTQAPKSLKSFIMSFYLLSVSLGNAVTAGINGLLESSVAVARWLEGPAYFLFFAALTLVAGFVLAMIAGRYKEEKYVQTADMLEVHG